MATNGRTICRRLEGGYYRQFNSINESPVNYAMLTQAQLKSQLNNPSLRGIARLQVARQLGLAYSN